MWHEMRAGTWRAPNPLRTLFGSHCARPRRVDQWTGKWVNSETSPANWRARSAESETFVYGRGAQPKFAQCAPELGQVRILFASTTILSSVILDFASTRFHASVSSSVTGYGIPKDGGLSIGLMSGDWRIPYNSRDDRFLSASLSVNPPKDQVHTHPWKGDLKLPRLKIPVPVR
jgi:hypothetical protein